MDLKKIKVLTCCLIGVVLIGALGSGCSLIKVNPEEDKKQVIAEIDGTPMLKDSFNNYLAYYQMYFETSGMTFPMGDEFSQLKLDLLDDLVRVETMTAQAKKDELMIDDSTSKTEVETMINSFKTSLGDEKYQGILSDNNSDAESFQAFLEMFFSNNKYANALTTNYDLKLKEDPSIELNTVVGTINGEDVKKDIYNYRLANEEFFAFYQTQKAMATDEETLKKANENIFNTIAEQNEMINYAKENNITYTQEEIESNSESHASFVNALLPGDDALQEYLNQKYLSVAQFREFEKQEAIGSSAAYAIQKDFESKVDVSDKEISKYYDDNKASYDMSTVSAKHILVTEEKLAKEVYEEAKDAKTVEDFDNIMKKYESIEGVTEAADLGAFNRGKMVSEFSDTAFSIEKGDVSEPVKTEFGYHVIYVYDKNEVEIPSLDDKRSEIEATIKSNKATEDYEAFTKDLLKKTKIEINEINEPMVTYLNQLKTDLNVTVYEKKIK
jgi:foldase protein PrsA